MKVSVSKHIILWFLFQRYRIERLQIKMLITYVVYHIRLSGANLELTVIGYRDKNSRYGKLLLKV